MLPVALEKATPLISIVTHTVKEYVCVMQLHGTVPESRVEEVLKMFVDKIYQKPPLRSRVKRALRIKRVFNIEFLEMTDRLVLFKVLCEAGTYIRKICHDVGLILGVGAHMRELRRTRVGPFTENKNLVRMQDLADAYYRWIYEGKEDLLRKAIMPMEYAVCNMPKVVIRDSAVDAICHGADLAVPGIVMISEDALTRRRVAILTLKGELVAVGQMLMSVNKILDADRGIAVKTRRVLMEPGTYPRMWKSGKAGLT